MRRGYLKYLVKFKTSANFDFDRQKGDFVVKRVMKQLEKMSKARPVQPVEPVRIWVEVVKRLDGSIYGWTGNIRTKDDHFCDFANNPVLALRRVKELHRRSNKEKNHG